MYVMSAAQTWFPEHTQPSLDFAQQQQSPIRTDIAAIETHIDLATFELRKWHLVDGTIWHRRNPCIDLSEHQYQRGIT